MAILMSKDPKAALGRMMKLPIKKFFRTGISSAQLHKLVGGFAFILGVQLVYSKRSRSMAARLLHKLFFGIAFFGFIIPLGILLLKQKMKSKTNSGDAL